MAKATLLTLLLAVLPLAACRPVVQLAPTEGGAQEPTPAQVATPTPKAGDTAMPSNTPSPEAMPYYKTGPPLPPPFLNRPATKEEKVAWRKEMEEKGIIRDGPPAFGPTTKGTTVVIKGINIKLPDDVYVQGLVLFAEPVVGLKQPSETPYIIIYRGKSAIYVTERTGKVLREYVGPNEQGTFDFLKKALQGKEE